MVLRMGGILAVENSFSLSERQALCIDEGFSRRSPPLALRVN